jgi:hypothetical protein
MGGVPVSALPAFPLAARARAWVAARPGGHAAHDWRDSASESVSALRRRPPRQTRMCGPGRGVPLCVRARARARVRGRAYRAPLHSPPPRNRAHQAAPRHIPHI